MQRVRAVDKPVDDPRDLGRESYTEDGARVNNAVGNVDGAIVRSRTFLGEKIEFVVDCGGELLQIARHSGGSGDETALAPGQRVRLHLPDEGVSLLMKGAV